jgi:hypothetical protein
MASQAAYKIEQAIGHDDNATTQQDVSNPGLKGNRYGQESERMKALVWMGKNTVEIGAHNPRKYFCCANLQKLTFLWITVDVPKPQILEDRDVILKVTGSTVCGSDLHLLHG